MEDIYDGTIEAMDVTLIICPGGHNFCERLVPMTDFMTGTKLGVHHVCRGGAVGWVFG